ncbi:MAG: hypothetical protein AB1607_00015 [Chloroflexota bacterium]
MIVGELFVPHAHEFLAGLADVLAVEDRAAEDARVLSLWGKMGSGWNWIWFEWKGINPSLI